MKFIRALLVLAFAWVATASAQSFPSKPIRLVIPWPPGGANDILGRPFAQRLGELLGQPVVVENRGGSSGIVGSEHVVRSPPDGYTLMFQSVTGHLLNASIFAKLPYDSVRDFAPVSLIASVPHVFVVHPSFPAKGMAELIEMARAKPGSISFASFGNGTTAHLSGELLKLMIGIDIVHVPYKGGGPALQDTLAGHVPTYMSSIAPSLPHIRTGKLRALAVTSSSRSKLLPEVPTIDESAGTKGYETVAMYGVFAPATTSREIVGRLNAEIQKILQNADFQKMLEGQGADAPSIGGPELMAEHMRVELPKWTKVVRAADIKAE